MKAMFPMKPSHKLAWTAIVAMLLAVVVACVGLALGSTKVAFSSMAFVLVSWACYGESFVYSWHGK